MPNAFTVVRSEQSSSEQNKVVVLTLDGYLDAHTAPQFERAIQDEHTAGRNRIAVDCQNLTYISSAGLGVFMSFIEEIRAAGGDIKLAGIIPKVYQVFEVLGFPALFDIVDDVPTALHHFAAGIGTPE